MRVRVSFAVAWVLVALGEYPLYGQTNLETNAGVQFNFSTPGAGNLALGGAFLALAFDASAAYTNPAGLTTIVAPEALVETRHWTYTHVFTDRGRIEGQEPTAPEDKTNPDHIRGLRDGHAQDEVTGPSFVSYVYPRHDWSFSIYRHALVNFEANFSTQGAYLERTRGRGPLGIPGVLDGRLAALRNRMEVDVIAYGGAAACRLGDRLSLGVAVSYFDFAIDSTAERFLPELFAHATFKPDQLVNFQTQRGDDHDWGLAAGFLWENRQKGWSLGGVYREGPDFSFQTQNRIGPGALVEFEESFQQASFHVPDVYGLGVGFRFSDAFRMALDYDRVRYSQLTQDFVDIFNLPALSPGQFPELNRFRIDDAHEIHFGMEYAFLQRWPVFTIRGGAWYDPDHSLRFEGDNVGFRAVFRRRGDQMHYTAGVGLALRRFQFDVAIDHSNRVSVIALSTGFRL